MSDRIARAFNRPEATRPTSKAFNRVWHAGLLQKRRFYVISGQIFDLISSFLVIGDFGWFWMGTLNKDIQLMLEFHKGAFLLHSSYYTLMTFLMMLSVILLSMLIILQYYPLL